ncbi:hypothetical protein LP316_11040 [Thalassotalea sp. LPB0316]|uniref:hypothetical protein n=1 Tax=Thalassotalea sp. LPB0316 TaxID=2769490 RepID=UPI001865B43E|nr:hypothetical protein [Thalassotalea sp. LPB0316]QOL24843.1 hypothetical protein LP316_11040 [Thalassotalea sp. LPB0316]
MTWQGEERRKHTDFWVKTARSLTIIAWLLFIVALIVSHFAAPETDFGIVRYHDLEVRKFWIKPLTNYLYVILWCAALISYVSMIVNRFRARRATDNRSFYVKLLLVIIVAWVIYLLLNVN